MQTSVIETAWQNRNNSSEVRTTVSAWWTVQKLNLVHFGLIQFKSTTPTMRHWQWDNETIKRQSNRMKQVKSKIETKYMMIKNCGFVWSLYSHYVLGCKRLNVLLERDYVTSGSLLSQIRLSSVSLSVCRSCLSVCNVRAPYSGKLKLSATFLRHFVP